ncbi:MAG: L-2-hydroxyglutarate oxidase [Chlorobiales bacterium]|nr:L-2-hydroxyglutarate oxidase [Chlorobiales bacterium]
MTQYDVAIIGGGIVGLSAAYQILERFPGTRLVLLEKEASVAMHQTGHNSGVLHSGIYYKPGSLKADNCREGKRAMEAFCQSENIPYDICGKVIVATCLEELPALQTLYERGQDNGVRCCIIGPEELRDLEPAASGVKAIHVMEAGIADFPQVCKRLSGKIVEQGATIMQNARVTAIEERNDSVIVQSTGGDVEVRYLINCAGLYSDRIVRMSGLHPAVRIVPFRGEYFKFRPEAENLCRNLIYPVPNPAFPFLGVHFTRMIGGGIECGPNAVLALAREGYRKTDFDFADTLDTLTYSGFLKLGATHWNAGLGELWRSLSKAAFVKALERLVPETRSVHLELAPAGVRAQAVGPDGKMVDDFLIQETHRMIHVCNAPSPAATASLNLGRLIAEKLSIRLEK